MLDNWTSEQLFAAFFQNSMDETAARIGRVAVIDDPEVEKLWDQYTQSRTALISMYYQYLDLKLRKE